MDVNAFLIGALSVWNQDQFDQAEEVVDLRADTDDTVVRSGNLVDIQCLMARAYVSIAANERQAIGNVERFLSSAGGEAVDVFKLSLTAGINGDLLPDLVDEASIGLVGRLDPLFLLHERQKDEFERFCCEIYAP